MKGFEEKFSELQADMISICLEYVEERADKVYVYASSEEGVISTSFYYLINNMYVEAHKVNEAIEIDARKYDVSKERQTAVLRIISEDIKELKELCSLFDKDMPTEMKLIYDVKTGKFTAEYQYELIYTHDDLKTASHIADEWFEEVKRNNL